MIKMQYEYDVIIIGGGLLGCFTARNLARYDLKIALLEKREDLCLGISRANTAIVYSGSDTKPGSVKTSMCVKASQGFDELCAELGVRYSKCGSIMICFGERGEGVLRKKLAQANQNGVRGARLLTREEVLELEPNISEEVYAGLYVPDTGTVMPWELCIAAAENAVNNGARIILNADVTNIERHNDGFIVSTAGTTNNTYHTRAIVNCAGLYADSMLEKVYAPTVRIVPDAGDYFVLDNKVSGFIRHVIFHEPEEKGKGLTLVPTIEGNILVGPTERELGVKGQDLGVSDQGSETRVHGTGDGGADVSDFGFETSLEGMELLRSLVREVVPALPMDQVIRSFGAVRPNPFEVERARDQGAGGFTARASSDGHDGNFEITLSDKSVNDFCIIEAENDAFISFVAVKTPGLTCANELGLYAADSIAKRLVAAANKEYDPRRKAQVRLKDMTFKERESLVCEKPEYGKIVCRCGEITEGEVLDAIRSSPGAATLDGVKHRAGTGLGRCQGGFCTQHITELLSRELGGKPEDYLSKR